MKNGINGICLYNVGFRETTPIKKKKKSKLFEIWVRFVFDRFQTFDFFSFFMGLVSQKPTLYGLRHF